MGCTLILVRQVESLYYIVYKVVFGALMLILGSCALGPSLWFSVITGA